MPTTLTLKNIPDEIYARLKTAAALHRRSLNSEAILCLETVLAPGSITPGERLARGTIYIAPGGRHLGIDRRLGHLVAAVSDGPPVNFCRPAVDVLFADAARHLGAAALGLVLTGMGSDGTDGAGALRRAGAAVIAQDEQSSTIWGMPGSIVRARHASAVTPLDEIGGAIRALLRGGAPLA